MPKPVMLAIALDPGITTGIATGLISPEDGIMEVGAMQQIWRVADLWDFLEEQKPTFIIYERFDFRKRARKGLELFSRELIGVANLWAEKATERCVVTTQTAAEGKGYYTNAKLKESNVFRPGKEHANDALRHLLHWYTFGPGFKYNTNGFRPA